MSREYAFVFGVGKCHLPWTVCSVDKRSVFSLQGYGRPSGREVCCERQSRLPDLQQPSKERSR